MTVALAVVHGIALFAMVIAVAIHWFSRRDEIRQCSRFAWRIVGVYAVALVAVALAAGDATWTLVALPVDILRTFVFTAVGVSCCVAVGITAFPLLGPDLGSQGGPARRSLVAPVSFGLLLAAAWSVYTMLLFEATNPELTDLAKRQFGETPGQAWDVVVAMIAVSVVALAEELVYRLGIQNFLARVLGWWDRRYWLVILLSATLWSIGHVGVLDPIWVKLVQIFPAGVALGWLARKHGIEACVLGHVVFNLGAFWMEAAGLLPVE
ncbi:MAG: CPBP family intramembrane metalloprotease [Gammaproteobacteria bacterium]|nr:CPBP family intramembrane metalloprotease [Gammaproteobacteria bacterium]